MAQEGYARPAYLADTAWVAMHPGDSNVVWLRSMLIRSPMTQGTFPARSAVAGNAICRANPCAMFRPTTSGKRWCRALALAMRLASFSTETTITGSLPLPCGSLSFTVTEMSPW